MLNSKRLCFVVDDDLDDQEIFLMAAEVVKKNNVHIKMFCRAKEFLLELSECTELPDYIFLDLNMPEMDGFECLSHLKKLNLPKNFKLIVLSTSGRQQDICRAKSLGAESYIVKPYSINEYSKVLSEHLT